MAEATKYMQGMQCQAVGYWMLLYVFSITIGLMCYVFYFILLFCIIIIIIYFF